MGKGRRIIVPGLRCTTCASRELERKAGRWNCHTDMQSFDARSQIASLGRGKPRYSFKFPSAASSSVIAFEIPTRCPLCRICHERLKSTAKIPFQHHLLFFRLWKYVGTPTSNSSRQEKQRAETKTSKQLPKTTSNQRPNEEYLPAAHVPFVDTCRQPMSNSSRQNRCQNSDFESEAEGRISTSRPHSVCRHMPAANEQQFSSKPLPKQRFRIRGRRKDIYEPPNATTHSVCRHVSARQRNSSRQDRSQADFEAKAESRQTTRRPCRHPKAFVDRANEQQFSSNPFTRQFRIQGRIEANYQPPMPPPIPIPIPPISMP